MDPRLYNLFKNAPGNQPLAEEVDAFKAPLNVSEMISCRPRTPPNPFSEYYKILGVSEQATLAELRAAFIKLARENNPSEDSKKERFIQITEAYQLLKKKLQDESGSCNFYNRLQDVFDKVFAVTEEKPMQTSEGPPSKKLCQPR
jgi:hypothetical protein